jgi:hypothetical protein
VACLDDEEGVLGRGDRLDQLAVAALHDALEQLGSAGVPVAVEVVDVDDLEVVVIGGALDQVGDVRQHLAHRPRELVGVLVLVGVEHVDDNQRRVGHAACVPVRPRTAH